MADSPHAPVFTPCGAKTRDGDPCKAPAMANGRCRMHGGKSLGGITSPTFKTGRYSKYIPSRLLERYHEAESDPDLLSLRAEIALTDGRLADLLQRVDTGEAKSLWEQAREANQEIQKAVSDENYGRLMIMAQQLDYLIGSGLSDYEAWAEIHTLLDQRRKLAESERKRLIEAEQVVRADKAMTLAMALLQAVKENVTDQRTLGAVQASFNRLLSAEVAT